jgi:hypothetical protein
MSLTKLLHQWCSWLAGGIFCDCDHFGRYLLSHPHHSFVLDVCTCNREGSAVGTLRPGLGESVLPCNRVRPLADTPCRRAFPMWGGPGLPCRSCARVSFAAAGRCRRHGTCMPVRWSCGGTNHASASCVCSCRCPPACFTSVMFPTIGPVSGLAMLLGCKNANMTRSQTQSSDHRRAPRSSVLSRSQESTAARSWPRL